jgi:hypothetical protein
MNLRELTRRRHRCSWIDTTCLALKAPDASTKHCSQHALCYKPRERSRRRVCSSALSARGSCAPPAAPLVCGQPRSR